MIPVSLSGGVEPGARTGTSVHGLPVVVWRGRDGAVRAWQDRCPHRGMRLSFGFVRENALVCGYHGWSFAGQDGASPDGTSPAARCLAVPAHPGMAPPGRAAIPVLPAAEALGMIWVGAAPADSRPPAAAASLSGTVHPVRSITVRAPVSALRAALEAAPPPGNWNTRAPAADGIITFDGDRPAVRLIAALQDRGDGSSAAHLVTTEAGTASRRDLCAWAALVRDHLAAVVLP
jgi:phenylpropionate dioxygenase-like ring-hydroxylating dioxygenase large terminal subunit